MDLIEGSHYSTELEAAQIATTKLMENKPVFFAWVISLANHESAPVPHPVRLD